MRICVILAFLLLPFYGAAAQDLKHAFLSPAFTGIGFSAHVLTVENQEFSRMESIESDIATLLREQDRAANSTNLSKFMNNVESRIYAQLSKQMVDKNEGFFSFEGTDISYIKTDELVTLTIVNTDGTTTTVSVPVGDFTF